MVAPGFNLGRQQEWLKRSTTWPNAIPGWQAEKVVGIGGNGLCGLWKYQDQDGNEKRIVVKQIGYHWADSFLDRHSIRRESTLMKACQQNGGTDHIVKLIKEAHETRGTGTHPMVDPADPTMPIMRLYMEYCDGGDLDKVVKQYITRVSEGTGEICPEYKIWSILECLVRALVVLEYGCEDPDTQTPDPNWQPIAHFDIKPHNMFFGGDDSFQPAAHTALPIVKLGDFGLAMMVPERQTGEWIRKVRWRRTRGWESPEALYQRTEKSRIGLPSNVFTVAMSVYPLVTQFYVDNTKSIKYRDPDCTPSSFLTYGSELVGDMANPYSRSLRTLLLRCLAHDQYVRPSSLPLLKEIIEARRYLAEHPVDDPKRPDPSVTPPSRIYDPLDRFGALKNNFTVHGVATPPEFSPPGTGGNSPWFLASGPSFDLLTHTPEIRIKKENSDQLGGITQEGAGDKGNNYKGRDDQYYEYYGNVKLRIDSAGRKLHKTV